MTSSNVPLKASSQRHAREEMMNVTDKVFLNDISHTLVAKHVPNWWRVVPPNRLSRLYDPREKKEVWQRECQDERIRATWLFHDSWMQLDKKKDFG